MLGLAFKGGTDDIRESPAIFLVQALLQEGSKITAYDPAAMGRTQEVMSSGITFANSAYEAAHGAPNALLILTEWEEFANFDLDRLRAFQRSRLEQLVSTSGSRSGKDWNSGAANHARL